jgi:hypothetical protein
MSSLALEIETALRQLDEPTARRLERLVRDALALVSPVRPEPAPLQTGSRRQEWIQRLDRLRASVGTGRPGTSTEAILDDLRSERC